MTIGPGHPWLEDEHAALIQDVPAFIQIEPGVMKPIHECSYEELLSATEALIGGSVMAMNENLQLVGVDNLRFAEGKSEADFIGLRGAAVWWYAKQKFGD